MHPVFPYLLFIVKHPSNRRNKKKIRRNTLINSSEKPTHIYCNYFIIFVLETEGTGKTNDKNPLINK